MKKVRMLALWLISLNVYAVEFKFIKIGPEFEQYLNQPQTLKSKSLTQVAAKNVGSRSALQVKEVPASDSMIARLLAATMDQSPFPMDGETSPLYQTINNYMESAHQQLGAQQVQDLQGLNSQFNLGTQNFSGFSWQKPFGAVNVHVDRQVVPPAVVSQWLVQDTFTFSIEATTFLQRLKDNFPSFDYDLSAFAGMTFNRSYTYYHYANSYQEGLASDFSKLFMSFMLFNVNGIQRMQKDEFIKREDIWTIQAGGMISTLPIYYVSFSAAALAQYSYKQTATVQRNYPTDANLQIVGMNVSTTKGLLTEATTTVQLEFFNLLKLALLEGDIEYNQEAKNEYNLSFNASQWQNVQTNEDEMSELRSILRGTGSVKVLEPYVVEMEESNTSSLDMRGSVLIWGKSKKSQTEMIKTIKDKVVKVFYRNYSQSTKVVQNLLSKLFSAFFYAIFKLPVGTKNQAIYSKQATLEFEATHAQSADPSVMRVSSSEDFSFILSQSYEASRTDRASDSRYKNDVVWFVNEFTTLSADIATSVKNETLKGPLIAESNLRVENAGFQFIIASSDDYRYGVYSDVCSSSKKSQWTNSESRNKLLKNDLSGSDGCVQDLGKLFEDFKKDYVANNLRPSLTKFKTFLTKVLKHSPSITHTISLFGPENTFLSGKLQATTAVGSTFIQSFSNGQFRGLGVIDNYLRENGTRTPASVND